MESSARGMDIERSKEAEWIALCQGKSSQTPKTQASLKCYYENQRHPYFYINPVKAEHLSEKPPIYQFYEMISENTVKVLKQNYTGRLRMSPIVGIERDKVDEMTYIRSSVGRGLDVETTPMSVIRLAEMITGLKVWDGTDKVQYVEYTYGRFFEYHQDQVRIISREVKP